MVIGWLLEDRAVMLRVLMELAQPGCVCMYLTDAPLFC